MVAMSGNEVHRRSRNSRESSEEHRRHCGYDQSSGLRREVNSLVYEQQYCDSMRRRMSWWLKFQDSQLESQYFSDYVRSMTSVDATMHFMGMVRSILVFAYVVRQGKLWPMGIPVGLGFGIMFLLTKLSWQRTEWYITNRTSIICLFRTCLTVFTTKVLSSLDPPESTVKDFANRLLMKSTVATMPAQALFLQVPFGTHLIVHGISISIAILWGAPKYCNTCFKAAAFTPVVASVGKSMEDWLEFMFLAATLSNHGVLERNSYLGKALGAILKAPRFSCWFVVAFAHAFVGYIIPTALLYCIESIWRLHFLKKRYPPPDGCERSGVLVRLSLETAWVACFSVFVVSYLFWSCLKLTQGGFSGLFM